MLDPVTIRYTEALFNLARGRGVLEAVRADVERLARELAVPGVAEFLLDERVSAETRHAKLEPLVRGMNQLLRNFVGLLFEKRREAVLAGLGEAFARRMLTESGSAEGIVQSARALSSEDTRRLEEALGKRLGLRLRLKNEIVPDVIGGVRVVVESRMIDLSLSGRLEGLRRRLLEAPLPSLEPQTS